MKRILTILLSLILVLQTIPIKEAKAAAVSTVATFTQMAHQENLSRWLWKMSLNTAMTETVTKDQYLSTGQLIVTTPDGTKTTHSVYVHATDANNIWPIVEYSKLGISDISEIEVGTTITFPAYTIGKYVTTTNSVAAVWTGNGWREAVAVGVPVLSVEQTDFITVAYAELDELYEQNGGAFNLTAVGTESGIYINGTKSDVTTVEYGTNGGIYLEAQVIKGSDFVVGDVITIKGNFSQTVENSKYVSISDNFYCGEVSGENAVYAQMRELTLYESSSKVSTQSRMYLAGAEDLVALGSAKHPLAVTSDAGVYHNGSKVSIVGNVSHAIYRSSGGYFDLMLTSATQQDRGYGISAINEGDIISIKGIFLINGQRVSFGESLFAYQDGAWVKKASIDSSDIICSDRDGSATYIVSNENGVTINGTHYAKGSVFETVGTHTIRYTEKGYLYERRLLIYKCGDVNADSSLSSCDIVGLKKAVLSQKVLDEIGVLSGDFNMDNVTDTKDIELLRNYIVMGKDGTLVLTPTMGEVVSIANELVTSLRVDYTLGSTKQYIDGTDKYQPKTVKLSWLCADKNARYIVRVSENIHLTNARVYETEETSLEITNLLPDTTYYWQVSAVASSGGETASEITNFRTEDFVTRVLSIDGISNTRDLGGYATVDGKHVKYGVLYRSGAPDNVTEKGVAQIQELGIKTRIDLRGSQGDSANAIPALDAVVNRISTPGAYSIGNAIGLDSAEGKALLKEELLVFTKAENYPIYFHCSAGRDRTGALAYLLLSLAGVEEIDKYFDYELSLISRSGATTTDSSFNGIIWAIEAICEHIDGYEGNTYQEKTKAYMMEVGLTEEQIDAIYNNIVEGE